MNDKQKAFAEEYLTNGYNATRAYLSAYPNIKIETAEVNGHKLLRNTKIKVFLDEKKAELSNSKLITRLEMLDRLNRRSELIDESIRLSLIDEPTDEQRDKLKRLNNLIKMSDAAKIDDMIARMNGWNEPDKMEVTIKEFRSKFGD